MSSLHSTPTDDMSTKGVLTAGVAGFAGIMLGVVAVLEILQGIAAIANDSVFVRGLHYTYKLDVTAWGWLHLFIGVVALAIAFLAAVANFAFLPYYPWWSMLVIAFNVLVIWALCSELGRDRVE